MVSKLNITPPTENRFALLAHPTHSPTDSGTSAPGSECGSDDEVKKSSAEKFIEIPVCLETRTLSVENLQIHEAQLSLQDEKNLPPRLSFEDDEVFEIAGTDPIPKYGGGFTQAFGSRPSKTPRKHQSFECRSEAAYSESAYSMVEGLDWEEMPSTPLNNDDMMFPALETLDTDKSDTCTCCSCSDVGISLQDFLEQSTKVEKEQGLKDWSATRKETMRQLLRKIEEEQGDRPRSARRFKSRPSLGARRIGPSSYSNPGPSFAKRSAERRAAHQKRRALKHDSTPVVVPPSGLVTPRSARGGFMTPRTPCHPIPETPDRAPVTAPDFDDEVILAEPARCCGPASNTKARRSVVTPASPVAAIELRWTSPVPEKVHSCPGSVKSDEQDKVFFKSEPQKSLSLPQFLERSMSLEELHRADCKAQEDWSEANGVFSAAENIKNSNFGPQTVTENESRLLHQLEEGAALDEELLRRVAADCYLRRCSSKSRKFFESINGDLLDLIWHAKNGRTPSSDLLQRVKNVLPYLNFDDLAADFEPMKRFMGQADTKTPHPALVLSGVDTRAKMPHLKKDPATRSPEETEKVWAERDGWTYLNLGLFDKNVDANLPEDKSDPKWKKHHDQQKQKTQLLEEKYMAKKRKARWKVIARKERQFGRGNFIVPPEPKLTKKEEKEIRSIVSEYGVHRFRNRGICRVMFQKKGGDGPAFKAALAMLRALKTMNRLRALGISTVRWMCASDESDFAK